MRDRDPLASFRDSKALPLEPGTRHFLNLQLPNADESAATQLEFQQAAKKADGPSRRPDAGKPLSKPECRGRHPAGR